MAKKKYSAGYYEPFAGYEASNEDQMKYWNMIKTQRGVVPTQFMEMPIPMANDVGMKGQKPLKVGVKPKSAK